MSIDLSGKCKSAAGAMDGKNRDAVAATLHTIASHAGLLVNSAQRTAVGAEQVETITISGSTSEYVVSVGADAITVVQRGVAEGEDGQ